MLNYKVYDIIRGRYLGNIYENVYIIGTYVII